MKPRHVHINPSRLSTTTPSIRIPLQTPTPNPNARSEPLGKLLPLRYRATNRCIAAYYSPFIAPSQYTNEVIRPHDPARFPLLYRLQTLPNDRLRWSFNAMTSKSRLSLSVMRSRLKRRWTEAFREALRQKGYNKIGRPLDSGFALDGDEQGKKDIKGMLQMMIRDAGGFEGPMEMLIETAGAIVDAVVNENQKVLKVKQQNEMNREDGQSQTRNEDQSSRWTLGRNFSTRAVARNK